MSAPTLPIDAAREEELLRGRPYLILRALRSTLGELRHDTAGLFGLGMMVLLVLVAVFAPLIAPHDPSAQSLTDRLQPPAWSDGGSTTHLLGTDELGRDVLSRLIYGARVSLEVGIAVVAISGAVGVALGLLAGYKGGKLDTLIMRWIDVQVAFPGLLMALIILMVVSPSLGSIIVVLAINHWMVYARLTRGVTLSAREMPYVEAAELAGCQTSRVIFRHIFPNLVSPLLTLAVIEFAAVVIAEAALSFLGLGIQPPDVSWGLMIAQGRNYIFTASWVITFPGIALALTVLGANLFASWLRVAADPQQREKRFAAGAASKDPDAVRTSV